MLVTENSTENSALENSLIRDVHELVESYPKVPITVDCVIFGFDNNELKVLLIRSDIAMYHGKWSLLGDCGYSFQEQGRFRSRESAQQHRSFLQRLTGGRKRIMVKKSAHIRPRRRPISRRSRFEGFPSLAPSKCGMALRSSASFIRISRLASVSRYRAWATGAGPRISLKPRTSTMNSPPSFLMRNISPTWTSRAGLARTPPESILPSSQARSASERVLKNRAAQSHLSIRTRSTVPFYSDVK